MSGIARRRPGKRLSYAVVSAHQRPAADLFSVGLSRLADCVNEALAGLGMRPAYVFSTGSSESMQMAIDVARGTGHRPVAGARPRPRPAPAAAPAGNDDEPGTDGTDEPEDAEHAEVWRLVALAQAGDGEAFGKLYDQYVDTVYRFIYYRVNDRALAEDFTSETFLRALRRISTISYQGRDIGAWFVTIARNIVLDHVKSARNRLEVTTADTIEGNDHAPSTEAAVMDTLTSERLMAAVNSLGDEQRECVMLRFIHGMSVSETAAIMGKNEGAIKALQHRAIRKLAELAGGDLR